MPGGDLLRGADGEQHAWPSRAGIGRRRARRRAAMPWSNCKSAATCCGARGVEVAGGQSSTWRRNQGSSAAGAEPLADFRPPLVEQCVDRGGRAFAGQLLHGAVVEVGEDLGLPAVPHVGPHGAQVGGGQHEEHLQQLGRADLDREVAPPSPRRWCRGGRPGGSCAGACGRGTSAARPPASGRPSRRAVCSAICRPISRWSSRNPLPRSWINSARCSTCLSAMPR